MSNLVISAVGPEAGTQVAVTIQLTDGDGAPVSAFTVPGGLMVSAYENRTDTSGDLTVDIVPNADLDRANTYYLVTVGSFTRLILKGSGTENLEDIVVLAPAALGPAAGLDNMVDVDETGKDDGDALVWSASASKWVPADRVANAGDTMTGPLTMSQATADLRAFILEVIGDTHPRFYQDQDGTLHWMNGTTLNKLAVRFINDAPTFGGRALAFSYEDSSDNETPVIYLGVDGTAFWPASSAGSELGLSTKRWETVYGTDGDYTGTVNAATIEIAGADITGLFDTLGAAAAAQSTAEAYADTKDAAHVAATDPHGDRAYTDGAVAGAITTAEGYADTQDAAHVAATDPHGDRAFATAADAAVVAAIPETVRDTIGAALVAGANVTITVDDPGDTITIAVSGLTHSDLSDFTEAVQDVVGAFVSSSSLTVTYNDAGNSLTVEIPNETIDDRVAALLVAGSGITLTYNDAANTLTIAVADLSGTYQVYPLPGALPAGKPSHLSSLQTAFRSATSGSGIDLVFTGDSILDYDGSGLTIYRDLAQHFNLGCRVVEAGFTTMQSGTGSGAGGTNVSTVPKAAGVQWTANTHSRTFTVSGDGIILLVKGAGTGTLEVRLTNGSGTLLGSIDTSTLPSGSSNMVSIDFGSYSSGRTIWIGTSSSSPNFTSAGFLPTYGNRTTGIRVWDLSIAGETTVQFHTNSYLALDLMDRINTAGRTLGVLSNTGFNDTLADLATDWGNWATDLDSRTPTGVLFVAPWLTHLDGLTAQSDVISGVAAAHSFAFADIGAVLGFIDLDHFGWNAGDHVHPGDAGGWAIAMIISAMLTGDPVGTALTGWLRSITNPPTWSKMSLYGTTSGVPSSSADISAFNQAIMAFLYSTLGPTSGGINFNGEQVAQIASGVLGTLSTWQAAAFRSKTANRAGSGIFRAANNEYGPTWRNNANSADKGLILNTSDQLVSDVEFVAPDFAPASSTGATQAVRYFRGTSDGPPTSGTWAVGDACLDQLGRLWACTTAGTPGSWTNQGGRFIRKTSTESVNNGGTGATLHDDAELVAALAVSATYEFEVFVLCDGATGGDIQCSFTVPTGATVNAGSLGPIVSAAAVTAQPIENTLTASGGTLGPFGTLGSGTTTHLRFTGIVRTDATHSGNLVFQWAQGSASATNTRVFLDSFLKIRRVA